MTAFTVQVAQRGLITLPKALRDAHHIRTGDEMTLLDLGEMFVLSPHPPKVEALADKMAQALNERGVTLEEMLQTLREVRAGYE